MEATSLGATSTADDVLGTRDLAGLRVLLTGVSAGLGVETARVLVARGAHVTGVARDLDKARAATRAVVDGASRGGRLSLLEGDLASLASVRSCAERLRADAEPLDLVVCNAGVMATPFGHTADGFETQLGVNHVGHFVLVDGILPLMADGARLVVLSSAGHRFADVDLEDPDFARTPYDRWQAYGRSKTANALFAVAFDQRHRARGLHAVAVHPGAIRETELSRHLSAADIDAMAQRFNAQLIAAGKPAFDFKTIPQGAATTVWAGVVAAADEVGGTYCEDCHVAEVSHDPSVRGGVQQYAVDGARARALWEATLQWVARR